MAYTRVMNAEDLQPGEKAKVDVDGKAILLANVDGRFFALNNRCPHLGCSLAEGQLLGSSIKCKCHGSEFDLETGKNLVGAKMAFLTIKVKDAKAYPVMLEDGEVSIDISE